MSDRRPSQIQREIKQQRPFRRPAHEVVVSLMRTADVVRQLAAEVLQPSGLTPQQYNVLRILRGAGEAGLPTLEIGERMIERAPGITRLLDRLERKGLVRRRRCPEDRRQVLCWPTPRALALLAELDQQVDDGDAAAVAGMGEREIKHLIRLLDRVRAGIAAADRTGIAAEGKAGGAVVGRAGGGKAAAGAAPSGTGKTGKR